MRHPHHWYIYTYKIFSKFDENIYIYWYSGTGYECLVCICILIYIYILIFILNFEIMPKFIFEEFFNSLLYLYIYMYMIKYWSRITDLGPFTFIYEQVKSTYFVDYNWNFFAVWSITALRIVVPIDINSSIRCIWINNIIGGIIFNILKHIDIRILII